MADPILKMAEHKRSQQWKNDFLDIRMILKNIWSHRDSNPALPIQSQVSLPHNHGITKNALKSDKIWMSCFKIEILDKFL